MFLLCFATVSQAFHAESTMFDKQLQKLDLSQTLYMQLVPPQVRLEELVSDPERHHGFRLLRESGQTHQVTNQSLWLFARLSYQGQSPIETLLHYDFPLADLVELYSYDRSSNEIQLLHRTGSQQPFAERGLPYRSFAFALNFKPGQELDIFVRIQDAGVIPLQLTLWQQPAFV